jgi:hypothetical protein
MEDHVTHDCKRESHFRKFSKAYQFEKDLTGYCSSDDQLWMDTEVKRSRFDSD